MTRGGGVVAAVCVQTRETQRDTYRFMLEEQTTANSSFDCAAAVPFLAAGIPAAGDLERLRLCPAVSTAYILVCCAGSRHLLAVYGLGEDGRCRQTMRVAVVEPPTWGLDWRLLAPSLLLV